MVSLSMVFTLGGSTLTVSKTSDYRLMSYSGFEASDYEIEIGDNAVGDGGYYQSSRISARSISVSFIVVDASKTATARTAITSFFKPKLLGSLAVTRGSTTRNIGFYLASKPDFINPDSSCPKLRVTVNLVCADPYFYATTAVTSNETGTNVITVNNPGDAECGCTISITATGGAVVNPYFTLVGTGEFVYVIQSMVATKVLQVSTVPGSCFAKYDGAVIYTYTLDSNFFKLKVGSNTITLDSDTGEAYIVGSISFTPRYLGV